MRSGTSRPRTPVYDVLSGITHLSLVGSQAFFQEKDGAIRLSQQPLDGEVVPCEVICLGMQFDTMLAYNELLVSRPWAAELAAIAKPESPFLERCIGFAWCSGCRVYTATMVYVPRGEALTDALVELPADRQEQLRRSECKLVEYLASRGSWRATSWTLTRIRERPVGGIPVRASHRPFLLSSLL